MSHIFDTTGNQFFRSDTEIRYNDLEIDSTIQEVTIINSGGNTRSQIFDPEGIEDKSVILESDWSKVCTSSGLCVLY